MSPRRSGSSPGKPEAGKDRAGSKSWKQLRRRSLTEGLLNGRPMWLVVGAVAWGAWLLRIAWQKDAELVYRTRLEAGESLVIRARRPAR